MGTSEMPAESAHLAVIGEFLARRDEPVPSRDHPAEILVLCGSAVLASLELAARALHEGAVRRILVTGGIGHSTPYLYAALAGHPSYTDLETARRPEAAILAEILTRHLDVPAALVSTEEQATNCGQNAEFSLRLLAAEACLSRDLVIVQDPTMQRRTHASFEHWQRILGGDDRTIRSLAPFVPVVGAYGAGSGAGDTTWPLDRFRDLVLGEVRRLTDDEHGYGPRGAGFIGHVDIPDEVAAAAHRLRTTYPTATR